MARNLISWMMMKSTLLSVLFLAQVVVGVEEPTNASTVSSSPPSTPSHIDAYPKQDKMDLAQIKSYLSPPNGPYYPPPAAAAIPVPLPFPIATGGLRLAPGRNPPPPPPSYVAQPVPAAAALYAAPALTMAASKGDTAHRSPTILEAAASNHPPPRVAEPPSSEDLLANHKAASPPFMPAAEGGVVDGVAAGFNSLLPSDQWPQPVAEMPRIVNLDVQCEKDVMRVIIEFDRPFNGVIFSKGHFRSPNCVHLPPGLGRRSATFDVPVTGCGMQGNSLSARDARSSSSSSSGGSYFENTIIVQYDPQVQEVWDQARRLRCSWHDQYEKSVTFRPFPVDMLDVVRADFAGDNVGCWMQIQVGKGPWASEVSGIVKIGQTMTLVLAIKDDESKFDMLVRNCIAHDGKRQPIQLVDNRGCVLRPKLMSRFTKIRNFGSSASVLSYAHFQAFKFPDSMEVYFQCTIQICRFQCPEQCSGGSRSSSHNDANAVDDTHLGLAPAPSALAAGRPRDERSVHDDDDKNKDVGIRRMLRVVSTGDLAFSPSDDISSTLGKSSPTFPSRYPPPVCVSTPGFAAALVLLLTLLAVACLVAAFLCIRYRTLLRGRTRLVSSSSIDIAASLERRRHAFRC